MVNQNLKRQTPVKPVLYASSLLTQHASGQLDSVYADGIFNNVTELQMYDIINGDPSQVSEIQLDLTGASSGMLFWRIQPSNITESDAIDGVVEGAFRYFNGNQHFAAILGHDLFSSGLNVKIFELSRPDATAGDPSSPLPGSTDIQMIDSVQQEINYPHGGVLSYDGWSMRRGGSWGATDNDLWIGFFVVADVWTSPTVNIGSCFMGSWYSFPHNCDLSTTAQFDWNVKQKKTIKGKTISSLNYERPNDWILPAWNLSENPSITASPKFMGRSGLRSWKLSYSFLDHEQVMSRNLMLNDNNVTALDSSDSEFDSAWAETRNNLFTNIMQKTRGNHLPFILQLDANSTNPDNFAVVRASKRYKIKQISPDLYSVQLDLVEQV